MNARALSFPIKANLANLLLPFLVGLAFWIGSFVLVGFHILAGVSPLFLSMMMFDSTLTTQVFMLPKRFGPIPMFQLALGSMAFGSARWLATLWNVGVVMIALIYLARPPRNQVDESITLKNTKVFSAAYLIIGLCLLPALFASFSFQYSSSVFGWLLVIGYAFIGWFYTKFARFGVWGAFAYLLSTLIFAFEVAPMGTILVAFTANLTGIYLALWRMSQLTRAQISE